MSSVEKKSEVEVEVAEEKTEKEIKGVKRPNEVSTL